MPTITTIVPAEPWRHRLIEAVFEGGDTCVDLLDSEVIAWVVQVDADDDGVDHISSRPVGVHNSGAPEFLAVLDIRRQVYMVPDVGDFRSKQEIMDYFSKQHALNRKPRKITELFKGASVHDQKN